MLQNAYLLTKIGADTAENEQHCADILPIGRRVADRRGPVTVGADGDGGLRFLARRHGPRRRLVLLPQVGLVVSSIWVLG